MIHPTAVVDTRAEIDPSVEIGPYVIIEGPVRVGAGSIIAPHVHLLGQTTIGPGCRIHTAAVIGDYPQDRSFTGGTTFCEIGPECVLREHVTVHRGTKPGTKTSLGARCLLMANAHVGHNCELADDVTLVNGCLLAGYVSVGSRAVISGNTGVHQFVRVGELAMIGGLSKITQDVLPFFTYDGPGVAVGVNVVGQRRAGLCSAERAELKAAYRRIYRMPGSLPAAVADLADRLVTPAGLRLLEFLQAPSKRGIHGHSEQLDSQADLPATIPLDRAA
uniref:Acyl-ACP--UDP-N-acetylglucosamine O-acyltransferase n=1 Tax=Schlesneria paludicola TaxID=360056 RepID=A0A7C2JYW1_9PLAN